MGKICIERATGLVREWARNGIPSSYNDAVHDLLDSDAPPLDDTYWNGTSWAPLPPKTNAQKDTELQQILSTHLGRAVLAGLMVGVDKGLWTMAELRAKYRSLAS